MQTIKIHQWACTTCKKDRRDFDPFDEALVRKYFPGLRPGECANCKTITLEKTLVSSPNHKMSMRVIDSQADIDAIEADLRDVGALEQNKVVETAEEMEVRIQADIARKKIATPAEIQALKDKYEDKV